MGRTKAAVLSPGGPSGANRPCQLEAGRIHNVVTRDACSLLETGTRDVLSPMLRVQISTLNEVQEYIRKG